MGGQNHQPTNRIQLIAPSAWLSQRVGCGFSAILEANNLLEDAIIAGMSRLYVEELTTPEVIAMTPSVYLERSYRALERSLKHVDEIEIGFDNLLSAAAREGYTGNPLASTASSLDLKAKFRRHLVLPSINEAAWNDVESRVATCNVLPTLKWEREQFGRVREPTTALLAVMKECLALAQNRGNEAFIEAIECNGIAMRQRYAQVFSLWNYLHAMFLYSALIMTELFYRSYGYPALTDWTPTSEVLAARVTA